MALRTLRLRSARGQRRCEDENAAGQRSEPLRLPATTKKTTDVSHLGHPVGPSEDRIRYYRNVQNVMSGPENTRPFFAC